MIACPAGQELALACERRLGRVVEVAVVFYVRQVISPGGRLKPARRMRVVLALAPEAIYLSEFSYWLCGMRIGAVLSYLPREGLVARFRRRWWAWPSEWMAELCWPESGLLIAGELADGEDFQRLAGLLAADEFAHELSRPARRRA